MIVTATAAAHGGTAVAALSHPHGLFITITLPAGQGRAPGAPIDVS